ncbi:DUF4190 domain-containing protein [Kitasatospora mediocidica]|uniref:DUF4190 domain-containing protein n=1 Tax=Kitasatospora mediocidica TaxID=58352 RepID=UPI000567FE06|nr:DUF4190 domain-containing protein [Kitasatospora mediocidica]
MTDDRTDQQPATRDVWAPPSPPSPSSPDKPGSLTSLWAPPGGGPWDYGPYLQPAQPATNGLAVAALVSSLTCFLWPLGIGLGIGALVQLRKRRQRGRALAVSGVVLGVLGLTLSTVFGAGFVHAILHAPGLKNSTAAVWSLKVGDCFDETSAHPVRTVAVSCQKEHKGEVASRPNLGPGPFPGAESAKLQVRTACRSSEAAYVTDPWARPTFVRAESIYPSDESSWLAGNHTGVCFLTDTVVGSSTGPLRRDASNLTPVQQVFLLNLAPLDDNFWGKPTGSPQTEERAYRDWIQGTATGISLAKAGLEVKTWPDTAQAQVAALLTELRADQPTWEAAAKATDTPVTQLLATLSSHSPDAAEAVARIALSLPDHDARLTS